MLENISLSIHYLNINEFHWPAAVLKFLYSNLGILLIDKKIFNVLIKITIINSNMTLENYN